MSKPKEIRYYTGFDDEFVKTPDQNYRLPENYKWVKDGLGDKIIRTIIGFFGRIFARIYGKFLHVKIVRNADLSKFKHTGIVVYGNHTQPVGDAFNPLIVCRPKKCYTVASTANLALPVIGKLIPRFILPVPQTVAETRQFLTALNKRLENNDCVIVYPEAHVWEYCPFIRPFPATSFSYAAENNVPAFCMTATYQKRKRGKKPKMVIYLDGPFYADNNLPKNERKQKLRDEVYRCMSGRSNNSNISYIDYRAVQEKTDEK